MLQHKVRTAILAAIVLAVGYYGVSKLTSRGVETRYVVAAVQKGTIIASVSGSGQVSALNQIDLKPKVSGNVSSIPVADGQPVKAGALIVQIDSQSAQKAVRDAEANLESAKLTLTKLTQPADALSLVQAKNALQQVTDDAAKLKVSQATAYQNALDTKLTAQNNLAKAHDDAFNAIAGAFLDIPNVVTGLKAILFNYDFSKTQWNIDYYANLARQYDDRVIGYHDAAFNQYQLAYGAYTQNFQDYKAATRAIDPAALVALLNETYATAQALADAVKSANNFIGFIQDTLTNRALSVPNLLVSQQTTLNTYTATLNTDLGNLRANRNAIDTNNQALADAVRALALMDQQNPVDTAAAERAIQEKQGALDKLKAGADPLDIQSQALAIKQRQNALLDARQALADYSIRAPFDGIVAKINVKKGDPASSAVATIITSQRIAQITLNEVDVAKAKVGAKATLTFDAVPDLTITGQVVQIDTVGTVTQGVVVYTIKIGFDTQDDRVRPGMSVSAAIITDAKQDVLLAPNAAVKSQGATRYVQVLTDVPAGNLSSQGVASKTPLQRQLVEIGLTNDSMTEVISGVKEGDFVVTRTMAGSAPVQTQSQSGIGGGIRIPGIGGGGFQPGR